VASDEAQPEGAQPEENQLDEVQSAAPAAFEVWNDYDPSMRFVTAYPMSAAQGTESSTVAYYAFEPGQHSGLHLDDAEELIYVADGEGEIFVSGVQQKLEAGGFNFIPKGVQHDVYAYGDVPLRLLSFFPSARVESTFTEIVLPFYSNTIASDAPPPMGMPQVEEISFDELPPGLAESVFSGAGFEQAAFEQGADEPEQVEAEHDEPA
jgi:quercetin dioxygenase-like cupin family protein